MEEAVLQAATRTAAPDARGLKALLLGVTPDVVRMRWPEAFTVFAVDGSWPMVQALWPDDVPDRRYAVCADWLAMPLRSGSCDLAIGDGSLISMNPEGFRAMAAALGCLLKAGGTLILRCYLQSTPPERPEEVFEHLSRGTIPSFHHFKLLLLMSMQRSMQRGVAVSDVYDRWRRHVAQGTALPNGPGWEEPVVAMMEHYRDSDTVYCFPTLDEFRGAFLDRFEEVALTGERYPIIVLKRR